MVSVRRDIKATTRARFPGAIPAQPMDRFLDDGLTSSCCDWVRVPKTRNMQEVIHRAFGNLRKQGAKPCQEHCCVETGSSLKWSCVVLMADKPLPDGGHKVCKRRALHDPASSVGHGV